MFKDDKDFKKFLAIKLKDKIIKAPNINVKDLMSALSETIELEDQRADIIKYALNSELFYAFSVSYMISLLKYITI